MKSSPALAQRLSQAESELERLRSRPASVKVEGLLPRVGERFRDLIADLPEAVAHDTDRARLIICRLISGPIRVVAAEGVVKFVTTTGQIEAAFARMAVGNGRQTEVVAGAGFRHYLPAFRARKLHDFKAPSVGNGEHPPWR